MPITAAKCTQCGANVYVDSSRYETVCDFCGTPFIVKRDIQTGFGDSQSFQCTESAKPVNSKATFSLVLGIASISLGWAGLGAILGIITGIAGLVLGIKARRELLPERSSQANAGFFCSIAGLVISSLIFLACMCACVASTMAAGYPVGY